MRIDLAGAMRAASRLTRDGKLSEATRLIQDALSGAAPGASTLAPKQVAAPKARVTRPLGEIVETLRQLKRRVLRPAKPSRRKPRRPPEIPAGAEYLARRFSCSAGARDYKLYVPMNRVPQPPLLVMLHGCTQDADDFAVGTRMNALAEEHGLIVAYPTQPRRANQAACWNWFRPQDQARDAGEPAILAGLTRAIIAEYGVDPRQVFIAGLSAGGAMAAVMGATHPDLFAATGIHSGLPYGAAHDVVSAFAAMRGETLLQRPHDMVSMRTIIIHGDADPTVHPSNAAGILDIPSGVADLTVFRASIGGRDTTRTLVRNESGMVRAEHWLIHGAGHAWSGGSPDGTHTDPQGPDASRLMLRFFLMGGEPAQLVMAKVESG